MRRFFIIWVPVFALAAALYLSSVPAFNGGMVAGVVAMLLVCVLALLDLVAD